MTLYNAAKMVYAVTKILVYDWRDHSKKVYENYQQIPTEMRDREVVAINSVDGMVELTLAR